ncbi:glycerol uptake facilitator protein [Kineosphaera limosa]|uniref:Glycerol uptake facilitator protein n=1 Tax=Kineosphaera limosa NBRC 100340 TaxID=1184609 RepID=K6XGK8_9MICO|nr:MIP/aquaporin family protein [Kineosphaera limosa]NYD99068.1 glycerol uptake facilitator protein [Kineosphaera limosa]GAB97969.1 glycerol uptake facilitator protein [Kineosphaera limosa NBRC 100340]
MLPALATSAPIAAAAAAEHVPLATVFVSEVMGTAMLCLLGCGVVANALLPAAKGAGGGPVMIHWGWGIAVFAGVYVAFQSGGHINPAVTLAMLANGATEFAAGVPVTLGTTLVYISGQLLGATLGAICVWLAYKKQFDEDADPALKLAVFSTDPEVRNPAWNAVTEAIGTFVLVFVILQFAHTPSGLGPLAVALLVVGIGASLGGPTGYAINPARDLGPRIAHAILPIPGKGDSNWRYAWVPVVGPILGGLAAGLLATIY